MTLIVVDQFRTTADSYAVESSDQGETVHTGFPKILCMPGRIRYDTKDVYSFHTVAFAGSATTFVPLWEMLLEKMHVYDDLNERKLKALCDGYPGEKVLLIFPFSNACLTVLVGEEETTVFEWREGSVHAFGSGYLEPHAGTDEYRSWYSIFYNAWDAGKIHGPDIHFMAHEGMAQAKEDTLKPETTVKRVKRRLPWGNAKRQRS